MITHHGKATSFADPRDITAFRRCKAKGLSDEECFKVGDNGIGCWDEDTSEGSGPSCALPPEDMEERWGGSKETNWKEAKNKVVEVFTANNNTRCVLKDRMPHRVHITNGAIIDLNPDACAALDLEPPVYEQVSWRWLDGEKEVESSTV